MNKVELETFKKRWQESKSISVAPLSKRPVKKAMTATSRNTNRMFQKGIWLDITLKLIILTVSLWASFHYEVLAKYNSFLIAHWMVIIAGVTAQVFIKTKFPRPQYSFESVRSVQEQLIKFYYQYYVYSLFITALTAVLIFSLGSFFYLIQKYTVLPLLEWDDFLVYGTGITVSFSMSYASNTFYSNRIIRHFEENLQELLADDINEQRLALYQKKSLTFKRFWLLALTIGIVVLLLLFT
jgi:hypothetical protein